MKKLCISLFAITLFTILVYASYPQVYFSPKGGCTQAIIDTLNKAKKDVYVQAYSFTSEPIAQALISAKKRGVNVVIILDKSQLKAVKSKLKEVDKTIETYIDKKHAIAHNKIMIIDSEFVLNGSFNYTDNAEVNNAENLLITDDKALATEYMANWVLHCSHSVRYAN